MSLFLMLSNKEGQIPKILILESSNSFSVYIMNQCFDTMIVFVYSLFLAQESFILKCNNLPINQNSLLLWNVSFRSAHRKSFNLRYPPQIEILFVTFRFSMRYFNIFSLKIFLRIETKSKFLTRCWNIPPIMLYKFIQPILNSCYLIYNKFL